jgi:hypothetical protein
MKLRVRERQLEQQAARLAEATSRAAGIGICHPSEVEAINRRQLLATGASLTAYVSLEKLLQRAAVAQTATSTDTSTDTSTATDIVPARKLIWINMGGGWDILEVTDPKVSSTAGIDMIYSWEEAQAVANSTDGTRIGRWLPNIAALGRDLLVVRGLAMGTTSHNAGMVYMDTGILSNAGRVNSASIPAIVASESTATIPIIQLGGGSEPQTDRGLLNPVSVVRAENLDLYRSMYPAGEAALQRKMAVLDYLKGSIERVRDSVGGSDRLSSLEAAEAKVRAQFASNVGSKLALDREDLAWFANPAAARGGMGGGADAVALALKLINNDIITCVNLGFGGFDTHQNQSQRLQPTLENVDFLIGRLVEGLRASGKLNETLIVMYSDFGRTPKVNGSNGRDHWPTGGALVIGGGIDGGRAVGASDDNLNGVDLVDPNTGLETTDAAVGTQLNPTHLGGMVLELTLGSAYSTYRPYLQPIAAMTRLRSS